MQKLNLATVDLNLLVALEVLLQECHISNAARRLNMSQPTMSRTLSRLRDAFNDQLLVRTPKGYVKTPRAEELEGPLAQTLIAAQRTFSSQTFDPSTARDVFRISTLDYGEAIIMPALTQMVRQQAPHVGLEVQHREAYSISEILSGEADIAIGVMPRGPTEGCVLQELITDRYVCVMCSSHPLADKELTIESYLAYDHSILVSNTNVNIPIETSLSVLGLKRNILRRSCHFLASLFSLRGTMMLQTSVQRLAELVNEGQDLVIKELPFEVPPIQVYLTWHMRNNDDPAHRWLREQMLIAANSLSQPQAEIQQLRQRHRQR